MAPSEEHRTDDKRRQLDGLITELEDLKVRARKYSLSMLVPMGREMSYRYQESLVDESLATLRVFRTKLG